jgi:hypothetical protein
MLDRYDVPHPIVVTDGMLDDTVREQEDSPRR